MPARANAFQSTEMREVYLTPKVSIGHIRLFTPALLLLSKLAMPNRRHKPNKDLLDVERLLVAEQSGLRLGLQPQEFARYLDAMSPKKFKKLEIIVERYCVTKFKRMVEAERMNEWEWERLHFPKPNDKEQIQQLKERNYEHWHSIFSRLKQMFAVSSGSTHRGSAPAFCRFSLPSADVFTPSASDSNRSMLPSASPSPNPVSMSFLATSKPNDSPPSPNRTARCQL